MTTVMTATPETLGLLMLAGDPHAKRMAPAEQRAAVGAALAEGADLAGNLRSRFGNLAPAKIASRLGVPITVSDEDPIVGPLWRFADYRERPARIVLYSRGLAIREAATADPAVTRLFGQTDVSGVFIAHELYHHAEAASGAVPVARRHPVTLLRIGAWRWQTGIAALTEIAAGAFAQALAGLPCHPKVLDLLALDALVPGPATAGVAARIAAFGQHDLPVGGQL